mmetsp:Transcript_3954/g.5482  ORF Transcript_3954/g.5482 Transcript_3954/m.5482 type:complete len:252 (+) Transcript_3954:2-757(+)
MIHHLTRGVKIVRCRAVSSLVSQFDESVQKLPLREAVHYTKKNLKWTADEFKFYCESHANALVDHRFKTGETIALWLPDSAEKHVALLSAAKVGLKVVDIDVSITEIPDIRSALKLANCKALYFDPVDETHNKLLLLRKAIPEFFSYDDTHGQLFHSKYFPTLRYFIHTGFDVEMGCLAYKSLFLPNRTEEILAPVQKRVADDSPLYSYISKDPVSGVVTIQSTVSHGSALNEKQWYFAKKLIDREYFEAL